MTVRIAIIDSGVNRHHSHVGCIECGKSFILENKRIYESDTYEDRIGHGTAIAGVICKNRPDVSMTPLRIFHQTLSAPLSLLYHSLEWAIDQSYKLIHLSLGTYQEESRSRLQSICSEAEKKGLCIVASARSPLDDVLPSSLDSVIGVCRDDRCRPFDLRFNSGCKVEFGAHGYARSLPGLDKELNFHGGSFAAAYVTGRIADILYTFSEVTLKDIKHQLIKQATHHGKNNRHTYSPG